ncbi:protein of unknown function [Muriicola jejuensis]|uniref:DUF4386 family protein n=1 Tax=Muriicola jejuensis TaxID=504488 RepID=A0A6P0UDW1_9FLAO|nr:DUF4386 domain-containing protein [Muriicola jejuensis]NER11451.1 DUF4386 family protein [Muriicola jejuensis]SMP20717.1 protein of unknown function [Muriicola jejuensis]
MSTRKYAIVGGTSYLIIFFAAVFANFFVIERILASPLEMVQENGMTVRFGIMAFLLTVVFDVVVAWALYELYKNHVLTFPSTLFRMMHAALMGIAIFSLPLVFQKNTEAEILYQVDIFNNIWPIGLFFFGVHLILLGIIIGKPKIIGFLLIAAGLMYMVDTSARFLMPDYQEHADVFLLLVAIPSVIGELSFAIWLLIRGGKTA